MTEEAESLREENLLLREQLELQKKHWLYSHHTSLSILLGFVYGAIVTGMIYIVEYFLSVQQFYTGMYGLLMYAVIPVIALLAIMITLKAPNFMSKTSKTYLLSFAFFEIWILYFDPLQRLTTPTGSVGTSRLISVTMLVLIQMIVLALPILSVPELAKFFGYKLVLDGSAVGFEVDADNNTLSRQLGELEKDFNVTRDERGKKSNRFYFTKVYGKQKTVLQFFLQSNEAKSRVVLVMHSVRKDIPMRPDGVELNRIGRSIMAWLGASNNLSVREIKDKALIADAIEQSKRSFHRQAIAIPPKKMVWGFLKSHWKDIAIIVTIIVAILAWLFPSR